MFAEVTTETPQTLYNRFQLESIGRLERHDFTEFHCTPIIRNGITGGIQTQ